MSSRENGLEVIIRSLLDESGFQRYEDWLKKASSETQAHGAATAGAAEQSKAFGEALDGVTSKLGEAAAELGGVVAAFDFLKDVFKEAIQGEQAMTRFAAANTRFGDTSEEAKRKNELWIESMEKAAGVGKSELVPLYETLIASTESVASAQAGMNVALGISSVTGAELGGVVQQLTRYMDTGKVRGVGPLASEIRNLTKEGKSQKEILEILGQEWGNQAEKVNTHAMQVKRAAEEWNLFKEKLGEAGLGFTQYLKPALEWVAGAIATVVTKIQQFSSNLGSVAVFSASVFDAVKAALHLNITEAKRILSDGFMALQEGFRDAALAGQKAEKELLAGFKAESDAAKKTGKELGTDLAGGLHTAVASAKKDYELLLLQAKASAQGQVDELLKVAAVYKQMSNDARLSQKERLQADENVRRSITEIGKLEAKEEVDEQKLREKAVADFFKKEDEKIVKYRKAAAERLKIAEAEAKAEGRDNTAAMAAYVELLKEETADYMLELSTRAKAAETLAGIEKKLGDQKLQQAYSIADAAMTLASDVFGQSKEMSIAAAIINTAEGVTKAFSSAAPPLSYVYAALTAAAGIAEIAKIESTSPSGGAGGSGFDDPRNDFQAYVGGQKWAKDMVEQWTGGIASGFAGVMKGQGGGQTVVTNNSSVTHQGARNTTYQIRLSGLFDSASDIAMRRFTRNLQVMHTLESNRTLK